MRHKLVIRFIATYTHLGTTVQLERTFTGESRMECNIKAAHYLAKMDRKGFEIKNLTRKDE